MMRKVVSVVGAVALAAALALPARAQNIVMNPGFDLDSPPGGTAPVDWTLVHAPSGSDFFVGNGPGFGTVSAPNSANFGAVGPFDDTLLQNLPTIAGDNYSVSFDLAHASSDGANDFSVDWGGVPIFSVVNQPSFGYTTFSFTELATTGSTQIAFNGREVPSWYDLDNVVVTDLGPSAVPEPGALAMLVGAALGGSLLVRRRRIA